MFSRIVNVILNRGRKSPPVIQIKFIQHFSSPQQQSANFFSSIFQNLSLNLPFCVAFSAVSYFLYSKFIYPKITPQVHFQIFQEKHRSVPRIEMIQDLETKLKALSFEDKDREKDEIRYFLSQLYSLDQRYAHAEELLKKRVEKERFLRNIDLVLYFSQDLVKVYELQNKLKESEDLMLWILQDSYAQHSINSSYRNEAIECLAKHYIRSSQWKKAEDQYQSLLEKSISPDSKAYYLLHLIRTNVGQNKFSEARQIINKFDEIAKIGRETESSLLNISQQDVEILKQDEENLLFANIFFLSKNLDQRHGTNTKFLRCATKLSFEKKGVLPSFIPKEPNLI